MLCMVVAAAIALVSIVALVSYVGLAADVRSLLGPPEEVVSERHCHRHRVRAARGHGRGPAATKTDWSETRQERRQEQSVNWMDRSV